MSLQARQTPIAAFSAVYLIALPWLNPFSYGPSPGVLPWLFSWACACVLWAWCALPSAGDLRERLNAISAGAWLIAATLSALIGLLQCFGAAHHLAPWVNSSLLGEAYANLRQRNQFASLTNIGLLALLCWSAQRLSSEPATRGWQYKASRVAAPALAALLALGNAASASRTGLLQLLLVAGLALVWGGWRSLTTRHTLFAALLAYGLAAWALPLLAGLDPHATGILARFNDTGASCASRAVLWRNVLHLIAEKPWLGWGWGELDYAHFVTLYPGERFCEILDNAHNLPLQLAVELGVPFAALVCGVLVWLVRRAQPWAEQDATRQMAWGVLAVIGLHSLLEYPLWYGPFQIAAVLCVWLLWRKPFENEKIATSYFRYTQFIASVLALAVIGFTAREYNRVSQIYLEPAQRAAEYREDTLEKIRSVTLFKDAFNFAELTVTPLTLANAQQQNAMAHALLHYSPEGSVVEKLIESAIVLRREDEALFYLKRYRVAYPKQHEVWVAAHKFASH